MSENTSYNPNGTWTSKEKKYEYKPKPTDGPALKPGDRFSADGTKDGHDGGDGRKKILIAAGIAVAVIVIGIAAYLILKPAPALGVSVAVGQPSGAVLVGDPFVLPVSYTNSSQAVLKSATLSVTLPTGISFAGQSSGQRVMDISLGDVAPGSSDEQDVSLIATGNPNSIANITADITYDPDSSGNAQYEANGQGNVTVGGPAVGLTITAPTSVASGQNFTVTVAYVNNAAHAWNDVKIDLQFPSGVFTFAGSSASPDSAADDEWDLGPLAPGASGSFTVTGSMLGQESAFYSITGTVNGDGNTVVSQTASLAIAASPLTITASLNNASDYVAGLVDDLSYTFSYVNNSNVTLQNAVITAKFLGAMFNFASLESNGSFSSLNDTITWSGANTPALLSIAPGQSGEVTADMRTLAAFPIRLPSDKDYALKVNAEIVSPTVPAGTAASSTVSVTGITNQVGGDVALAAVGYFDEPTASVTNLGPYPPQVNDPTQYTIHWRITNYSTDIANVTVSAYLQSGTDCTGFATSTVASSTFSCNAANGLVTWTIPAVPATTGVISPPAEAVFQVENTPAVNEVGRDVVLLGPSSLAATDDFTGAALSATASAVDTSLPSDSSATSGDVSRKVIE